MPQSLIKLKRCTSDSLFRQAVAKLKNMGVLALKVFISLECQADFSL